MLARLVLLSCLVVVSFTAGTPEPNIETVLEKDGHSSGSYNFETSEPVTSNAPVADSLSSKDLASKANKVGVPEDTEVDPKNLSNAAEKAGASGILEHTALGREGCGLGAAQPSLLMALPAELVAIIFKQLVPSSFFKMMRVSKCLYTMARQIVKFPSTYEHKGTVYFNFTQILHDHDALVQTETIGRTQEELELVLKDSVEYMQLLLVVRDSLGWYVRLAEDSMIEFPLCDVPLDILNNECTISALPYILDQSISDADWVYYIHGLADIGRFDLIEQMTFEGITFDRLAQLLGVLLPESVLIKAISAFQKRGPRFELSGLLAFLKNNYEEGLLAGNWCRGLIFLRHLYERGFKIPNDCYFTCGLDEISISFWMYVLTKEPEEAEQLMRLAFEHGDDETRLLARVFYKPAYAEDFAALQFDPDWTEELGVYQAMLIRFRFRFVHNPHIVQHYETMLENPLQASYHVTRALLDCGQFQMIAFDEFYADDVLGLEALAAKMYRLNGVDLGSLIHDCITKIPHAAQILKHLVKRNANAAYIQLVWSAIQSRESDRSLADYYCLAPISVLKTLALGSDIWAESVQVALGMVEEIRVLGRRYSAEAYVLDMVMFWEAPEDIVEYFLDQAPEDFDLGFEAVEDFVLRKGYSGDLCNELIRRLKARERMSDSQEEQLAAGIMKFRPDLAEEWELYNIE